MIVNRRYLEASVFSFFIHAAIFLYLYGLFNSDNSQAILISKPIQIELKFDTPDKTKKQILPSSKIDIVKTNAPEKELVHKKITNTIPVNSNNLLIESSISDLLSQENEIEISEEQKEISMYAQQIISTIENAWIKPKNIPEGLKADLRLTIRPSGRIIRADLVKSSGNIRFDNSALQAVRRVETFNFFNSISKSLFEKEFQKISISFNPL